MHRGRIFPTKGVQTMASPYTFKKQDYLPNGKAIPGGLLLYRLDTNYYKNMLAGMLEIEPGDPGCWWYHKDVTADWARQMTVEGINEKGLWENPHGRDNHAWDCAVLLLMGHDMARVATWKRPEDNPKKKQAQPAAKKITLW
jgi:phage terminase large subunit GpA-like protein